MSDVKEDFNRVDLNSFINLKTVIIFLFVPIALLLLDWCMGSRTVYFSVNNRYIITLHANSVPGFMDWTIIYDLRVKDKNNGKVSNYNFFTGEGPYVRFKADRQRPHMLFIEGYQDNNMQVWELDMDKHEFTPFMYDFDSSVRKTYADIYELGEDFILTKK